MVKKRQGLSVSRRQAWRKVQVFEYRYRHRADAGICIEGIDPHAVLVPGNVLHGVIEVDIQAAGGVFQ
jgi:hypothetical protein